MVGTGALRDEGMIYFDARLSHTYPTVEIRVADVGLDPSTPVLLATLVRGLVETAAHEWRAGLPPAPHGVGLLRLAAWRAGRSGLDEQLIHPLTMTPRPAGEVVRALLAHVRDALESSGDMARTEEGVVSLLAAGNGAAFQRDLLKQTGSLRDVVAACVRKTSGG